MLPGVPERRSHDYVRAGTTTLFAALEVTTGKVIGSLHRRHRAVEFKKFLAKLDKEVPADLDVHLILDNYVTHKTPVIKKWLLAHRRFHLHFTPTSSSWLNLVERWFAELTQKSSSGAFTAPSGPSKATSGPGSPTGTTIHDRSSGRRPPTRSSTESRPTADESLTQVTTDLFVSSVGVVGGWSGRCGRGMTMAVGGWR
jgi:transposase